MLKFSPAPAVIFSVCSSGLPFFHRHPATPPTGAAVLQIRWENTEAMEAELARWQPHWIDGFQKHWCAQHASVCNIPGCSARMILDGGWKLFRTPVCEAPLPSEDLPVPTLQLRRICAARTQRGRRTCSCHQSLGPAIRDMLLPFKYRLQLKCCLNTRAAPHAGPDFHLRSEEALLPAQVRRAGRPPGARECCTQKDKLGGGRSRCVGLFAASFCGCGIVGFLREIVVAESLLRGARRWRACGGEPCFANIGL